MVGIVQPDGDEIARAGDAGAKTDAFGGQGQVGGAEVAQAGEAIAGQHRAANVGHHGGKVTDAAIGIDEAGLLGAG